MKLELYVPFACSGSLQCHLTSGLRERIQRHLANGQQDCCTLVSCSEMAAAASAATCWSTCCTVLTGLKALHRSRPGTCCLHEHVKRRVITRGLLCGRLCEQECLEERKQPGMPKLCIPLKAQALQKAVVQPRLMAACTRVLHLAKSSKPGCQVPVAKCARPEHS